MAVGSPAALAPSPQVSLSPAARLLLVRVGADGGATRSELQRDFSAAFSQRLSPADWRRLAETAAGELVASGAAIENRSRLSVTADGAALLSRWFGQPVAGKAWPELRDVWLTAKALGIEGEPASKLKALLRQDSLRGLIVQKAYGLPLKKNQPAAKIRAQLALHALERAFGNKIKAGFGQRDALPAKAGRLLAGQLARNPRDFGTDARLIAELAAEHAGAKDIDTDSLRSALLRGLAEQALDAARPAEPARVIAAPKDLPAAANDTAPRSAPPASLRPDVVQFSLKVMAAAARRAEGWPGNRKAYISHVWTAIRESEPQWGLSEIEFKCMLAEAHRAGRIVLANADLKDKKNLAEIESSAVLYKNTVWHFVRVEE